MWTNGQKKVNLEKGNDEVEMKTRIFCSRIKILTLLPDMYYLIVTIINGYNI